MQLDLRSRAKKVATAAVILLLAGAYLAVGATRFLAAWVADDSNPVRLQRAARLDRSNAEFPYKLGDYYLLGGQAPQQALYWLRRATALNPLAARYWVDLAIAQQTLGRLDAERQSLERALAVDSHTPDIAWEAANLYLAQGSPDAAMKQFHTVLENDPPLTWLALSTCWKMRPDIDYLLSDVVPPGTDPLFLKLLLSQNQTAASEKVWERIFSQQQPVERQDLFDYIRYLIQHHEVSQAQRAWQEAAQLSDLGAYQASSENLLINGDFSLDILNGGFDWLHHKNTGVTLALDPNEGHSGSRSLRITFDGPPVTDAGIGQMVPVDPGTRYEFSAFYKAEEMDGAGGMEFSIQDLYHENPLFMSDDLHDADFWKKISGSFVTGTDTRLVLVHLVRVPSGRPIRGKLWIDGLQLIRSEHASSSEMEAK
jgi:tetratricopeptide (TPR) repeat protein